MESLPNRRILRPRPPPKGSNNNKPASSQNHPDLTPSLPAINQTSCFLFTVFPPEIRNRIYTFSLESEDTSTTNEDTTNSSTPNTHLYRQNAFYYRPGYKQPKRIQTALLQTCQQIYEEASLLPASINEHTFWFYRAPPHVKDASSPLDYFQKMTAKQRAQVRHIHLFTQQYFLEDNWWTRIWAGTLTNTGHRGSERAPAYPIAPKKLTITFRHTDWWFWENNDPLGIDPFRSGRTRAHEMGRPMRGVDEHEVNRAWGNQFIAMPGLEELVIEFETIMRKRDQLDAIIQRALSWKFPVQLEKRLYLVAEPTSRSAYTWVGAKEGDLKRQPGRMTIPNPHAIPEEEEVVVPAVPVLRPFDAEAAGVSNGVGTTSGSQAGADSNTEEFYVVFLTWKRQVVDQ
ncbi:uncharacterized protein N7496_010924 [Penicillium cataractarum]|uniref:Uncharacterized protein n=1 Tax=Penicillium cataractarum TaxID=2100454 RepID=A0A9W9UXJ8_9EURO|nr:uncharacterized protein N7496_010924 [Penicillium cataractarum]KAJ5358511.1 hypothetical protein N7496_010924 [Penicillium cataractarum]